MAGLTLGTVALAGFEVPGLVRFGGAQALAVHKLPGGQRIIDVMGRDDSDLTWSGVIAGPDAADRARLLDGMRVSGGTVPLSWDAFYYAVIISTLHMDYTSPWWIPYRIVCKVVADQAEYSGLGSVGLVDVIAGDLGALSVFGNFSGFASALDAPGSFVTGTAANAGAVSAAANAAITVATGIGLAEQDLLSNDIDTAVSASGTLAYLTAAQGFIGRLTANLQNAGS